MRAFLNFLFAVVAGFVFCCKEDVEKSNACADFPKTTINLKGKDLNVVRSSINGKWKLAGIGGGCCNVNIPGPPNTYLTFLDSDVFIFRRADTLAAGGKIQWEKPKGWTDLWLIENIHQVIILVDSGKLITSDSGIPWEAQSWTWERDCVNTGF